MTTILMKENGYALAKAKIPEKDPSDAIAIMAKDFSEIVTDTITQDARPHEIGLFARYDTRCSSDLFSIKTYGTSVKVDNPDDTYRITEILVRDGSTHEKDVAGLTELIAGLIMKLHRDADTKDPCSISGANPLAGLTGFLYGFYQTEKTQAVIHINHKEFHVNRRTRNECSYIQVSDGHGRTLIHKENISCNYPKRIQQLAQTATLIILCSISKETQGFYIRDSIMEIEENYDPKAGVIKRIAKFAQDVSGFIAERTDFMREDSDILLIVPDSIKHMYLHAHTGSGKMCLYDEYGLEIANITDRTLIKTTVAHAIFDILAFMD